jgi:phosphoglycerate dehydrogenase-like enzyme
MKLLIHPAIDHARLDRIVNVSPQLQVVNASDLNQAMKEIVDATAFFGKLTPDLLSASTQLKWVQSPTASLEHYLFPALVEHPCVLSNMRGLFSDVIADHVMGFVLCFARNLHVYLRQQQQGIWSPIGDGSYVTDFISAPGTVSPIDRAHQHLSDCTLGVVGVGAIGAEVLRRAQSFGMTVLGVDPIHRSVPRVLDEVWTPDRIEELMSRCDYVVIAAPHTPQTQKLFCRSLLQQMKTTAVLINIGRGAIVDLADLADALQAGELRGAALDVCETEPLPTDHPLWRMPNVIITPHVAAASPRVAERHLETLLENVRRFVQGQPPATLVDKRLWY